MPKGAMKSVDAHRFAMVPKIDVPRSAFDVNHVHKTTFSSGYLIPVYIQEVLPGDTIKCKMHAFVRLAPAVVPMMDNLILESFFFFVPNRLVWANWKRFMGEQNAPTDATTFLVPKIAVTSAALTVASIYDFMGITLNSTPAVSVEVSSLPFRAYNLIFNDWFRDEDLQVLLPVSTGDGPDAVTDFVLVRRGKRHDYFTSARPWPLKPTTAQQTVSSMDPQGPQGRFLLPTTAASRVPQIGAPVSGLGVTGATTDVPADFYEAMRLVNQTYDYYYPSAALRARAQGSSGAPDVKVLIGDLRQATMIQRMMEINQRGGSRYTEIVRAHFGVVSPDARLQRPEYLGGGRSFVTMNQVLQTSATGLTGGTTVLGEPAAALGTISVYDHGFSQSFTEHGIILGIIQVRADLSYQQGIRRMWLRRTQFDFYWPSLAHLGEQAIRSSELFVDGGAGDDDVFGYQERWAEYKYQPSRVSSMFRSSAATPLDMWHLSQNFATRPLLNTTFIQDFPPLDRVLQVASWDNQQFLMDALFEERMVRCMPMFSIPGMGPRL